LAATISAARSILQKAAAFKLSAEDLAELDKLTVS
jgi:hypothetical protein